MYAAVLLGVTLVIGSEHEQPDNVIVRALLDVDVSGALSPSDVVSHASKVLPKLKGKVRAQVLRRRGDSFVLQKRYSSAEQDFREADLLLPNDADIRAGLAAALAMQEKTKDAFELVSQLLKQFPRSARCHRAAGNVYSLAGDYDKAVESFTRAISLDPTDSSSYHNRALWHYQREDYQRALADIDKAIGIAPYGDQVGDSYALRGALLSALGRYREAIPSYHLAIKLDPANADAAAGLAEAYFEANICFLGAHVMEQLHARWPENVRIRGLFVILLVESHQVARAATLVDGLLRSNPDESLVHVGAAMLRCSQRDYKSALRHFLHYVRLDKSSTSLGSLSMFLSTCPDDTVRNGKEALLLATQLCEKSEWKDPSHLVEAAAAYAECRQFDKASSCLQKAEDLLVGRLHSRVGRNIQAMRISIEQRKPYRP